MADVKISALPAATSIDDADLIPIVQSGVTKRGTGALARNYPAKNANTVLAGPASGAAAVPTFRALAQADIPARNPDVIEFLDDFVFGNASATAISGTGAAATTNSGYSDAGGHPGVIELVTGTTTSGRASLTHGTSGIAQILLGNGAVVWEAMIQIPTALSDGTETYAIIAGFNDLNTGTGTDAVMFRYTHSVNGGRFECVTRSNGVETAADSGIAAAINTWYKLRIEINAAASSVAFYINGSLVATNATNIPSGASRQTTPQTGIIKSAGTTSRSIYVDYLYSRIALTTAR